MKIPLSQITVGERQRQDFGDIAELANSIKEHGQIQAIGLSVQADGSLKLVWGMRRYLAHKHLAMEEIDAVCRTGLTTEQEQEIEYEEDIRRKDRSWQEKCIAVAKLFRLKGRQARQAGSSWTVRKMSDFTGMDRTTIAEYVGIMSDALETPVRDAELWVAPNYTAAIEILRSRQEKLTRKEMDRRLIVKQQAAAMAPKPVLPAVSLGVSSEPEKVDVSEFLDEASVPASTPQEAFPFASGVSNSDSTSPPPLSLMNRVHRYNAKYHKLWKQQLICLNDQWGEIPESFIVGFWFVGGGNVSDFYGSYQTEYLERIKLLFPDKKKVVHLFSGSLPASPDYTRVGIDPTGQYKSDLEIDVHDLSSHLPFKPDLIYADPPYSVEDSEHYKNSMVNRERIIQECAIVLEPGGFLVWMDQALPLFSNQTLKFIGNIAYIRSTGNRFRTVSIFQKPCLPIISPSVSAPIPIA